MKTESNARPVHLFISYSHKDAEHKEKLWRQLYRPMSGKGILWHDLMIEPGQKWKEEIWIALHQSDIILFLMSDDGLHSNFIWEVELKRAFERHEKNEIIFIPIYLRECNWQEISDLKQFQAIPRDNRPMINNKIWASDDEPFAKVAAEVIAIVKTKWQELNNAFIEENRPKRFAGIFQFLQANLHFFEMGKIAKPSSPSAPEDFMYFVGIAIRFKEFAEVISLANANGINWAETTFEKIEAFRDICEQMETVWKCSDYVWGSVSDLHEKTLRQIKDLESNIWNYVGKDWRAIDEYKSKYALPLHFTLHEYEEQLRSLAEESLSALDQ